MTASGRWRSGAVAALGIGAALVAELALLQWGLPALHVTTGAAPNTLLFLGLMNGLVNSLTAVGIILIYRTLRIINMAQAAIGVAGATMTFNLIEMTPVPFVIALLLGLLTAAAFGVTFHLVV